MRDDHGSKIPLGCGRQTNEVHRLLVVKMPRGLCDMPAAPRYMHWQFPQSHRLLACGRLNQHMIPSWATPSVETYLPRVSEVFRRRAAFCPGGRMQTRKSK